MSLQGFVRRLMPQGFFGSDRVVEVIDWADVGYLATDTTTVTVQLKSSKDRGLRAILENSMLEVMYEIPGRGGVKEVHISEDTILRGEKPLMVFEKEAGTA